MIDPSSELSTEEIAQLGMKNADTEVEKFISANTQELGPQKWLCPLSGKKFKGPEFVLKHIQNKHAEKIDEVRLEVRILLIPVLMIFFSSVQINTSSIHFRWSISIITYAIRSGLNFPNTL